MKAIKQYMFDRNMTQEQFARKCNIGKNTLSFILNGKASPDWHTMQKIYDATDGKITPNDLMGIETITTDTELDYRVEILEVQMNNVERNIQKLLHAQPEGGI
jgi:transcriptional regulator with XRE-family HTH domain